MHRVRDIMTKDPKFCTPESDLRSVAQMMCDYGCGEIPVVESQQSRRPIGVVTDRDICCRAVAQGKDPSQLKARDCMTQQPVTVRLDARVAEAERLMETRKVRRLPVVDLEGFLCGIVAQADIARHEPSRKAAEVLREVSQPA